jgi:hypothetical protein
MAVKPKKKSEGETLSTLFGLVDIKPDDGNSFLAPKVSIWDYVNSISENKNYLFEDDTAKEYTPYTINRAFSIHIDTLHHAAMMNQAYNLDKKMQHDYYFYALPKKVRRKKWLKKSDEEKAEAKILADVAEAIGYSLPKTESIWKILTTDQRKEVLTKHVYPNYKNEKQNAKSNK